MKAAGKPSKPRRAASADSAREFYTGATGEPILREDRERWIATAEAACALVGWKGGPVGTEERTAQLSDLLSDLLHYARRYRLDFNAALEMARENFNAETERARTPHGRALQGGGA